MRGIIEFKYGKCIAMENCCANVSAHAKICRRNIPAMNMQKIAKRRLPLAARGLSVEGSCGPSPKNGIAISLKAEHVCMIQYW